MASLPPLYTRVEYTASSEYSSRSGTPVDSFGIHHAVTTSLDAIISLSKPGGRTVSMTFAVKDHERVLVVPLDMRPFTSASRYDFRSWTVEAANMTLAPDYLLSDATYESLAIIAAWAHLNGVPLTHGVPGLYEHKNLYQWFGASYATACAGPHFSVQRVINRANELLAATQIDHALLRRQKEETMYIRGESNPSDVYNVFTDANGKVRVRYCGKGEAAYALAGGLVVTGDDKTLLLTAKEGGYEYQKPIPLPRVIAVTEAPAQ